MGLGPGIRQPFDWHFADEISDENDIGLARGGNLKDTDASNFKPAAQGGRSRRDQPGRFSPQQDLVVRNEPYDVS